MIHSLSVTFCLMILSGSLCFLANPAAAHDTTKKGILHPAGELQSSADQATVKNKFDLVYESLKDKCIAYNVDVMKTLAFLIITIGWFVTSNKSRIFFRESKIMRLSSIVAVLALAGTHVYSCLTTYRESQGLVALLNNLEFTAPEYYRGYQITFTELIKNSIQNVALFGVLIVLLFSLKRTEHTTS